MPAVPRVSVVIPTYNREKTIAVAIQSVLDQTMGDLEVLVIDDGSSDGTEAVVRSLKDVRVQFVRPYAENRGAAAARNAGISMSKGEFIAFQDSDDIWTRNKLELQLGAIENAPEVGVVYGTIKRSSSSGERLEPGPSVFPKEGDMHRKLLERSMVGTPVALVRRAMLKEMGGFDTGLKSLEDWDLFIGLSGRCRFAFVDEVLCLSHELGDSLNASYGRRIDSLEKILQKRSDEFLGNPKAYMGFCLEVGIFRYREGDALAGRSWVRKGMKAYPWSLGPLLLGTSTFLGRGVFLKAAELTAWAQAKV
jgi:glycosyltransferase involved in cell wall biosynthesis